MGSSMLQCYRQQSPLGVDGGIYVQGFKFSSNNDESITKSSPATYSWPIIVRYSATTDEALKLRYKMQIPPSEHKANRWPSDKSLPQPLSRRK